MCKLGGTDCTLCTVTVHSHCTLYYSVQWYFVLVPLLELYGTTAVRLLLQHFDSGRVSSRNQCPALHSCSHPLRGEKSNLGRLLRIWSGTVRQAVSYSLNNTVIADSMGSIYPERWSVFDRTSILIELYELFGR